MYALATFSSDYVVYGTKEKVSIFIGASQDRSWNVFLFSNTQALYSFIEKTDAGRSGTRINLLLEH